MKYTLAVFETYPWSMKYAITVAVFKSFSCLPSNTNNRWAKKEARKHCTMECIKYSLMYALLKKNTNHINWKEGVISGGYSMQRDNYLRMCAFLTETT